MTKPFAILRELNFMKNKSCTVLDILIKCSRLISSPQYFNFFFRGELMRGLKAMVVQTLKKEPLKKTQVIIEVFLVSNIIVIVSLVSLLVLLVLASLKVQQ